MVAVNVLMPREVKLKGLKEAPHSAIYRTGEKKTISERKKIKRVKKRSRTLNQREPFPSQSAALPGA